MDNTFVELVTIYHGSRFTRAMGFGRIICYSDSQIVLNFMLKDYTVFYCYGAIIANI
jgi:ribonuclease HI